MNKLNKIKLNNLYKYIKREEENFENLKEIDRTALERILKNLDLYIKDDTNLPEEYLFELQLKYYVITEIYLSSYRVYINDLDGKLFIQKFLDAKKYCPIDTEEDIVKFISYLIVCLRKELKK